MLSLRPTSEPPCQVVVTTHFCILCSLYRCSHCETNGASMLKPKDPSGKRCTIACRNDLLSGPRHFQYGSRMLAGSFSMRLLKNSFFWRTVIVVPICVSCTSPRSLHNAGFGETRMAKPYAPRDKLDPRPLADVLCVCVSLWAQMADLVHVSIFVGQKC